MNWQLGKFKREKDVLLIRVALAKRRQSLPSQKIIALPIHPDFEPWTLDLLKRIAKNKKLEFDLTRVTVNKIVRERLSPLLNREIRARDLRQLRLEHLAKLYNFDLFELATVAGKSITRNLIPIKQSAEETEAQLQLAWRRYYPKLLKPIHDLMR